MKLSRVPRAVAVMPNFNPQPPLHPRKAFLVALGTGESRPVRGSIPAENLVVAGTAGDNGTSGRKLYQLVLGYMVSSYPLWAAISSGNVLQHDTTPFRVAQTMRLMIREQFSARAGPALWLRPIRPQCLRYF